MNENRFRSAMALHGDSVDSLAEYLGISPQSLRKKIKEDGTCFKQTEINQIITKYNLTNDETVSIFFT